MNEKITLPQWRGYDAISGRLTPVKESLLARAGEHAKFLAINNIENRLAALPPYDRARPYSQLKRSLAALDVELCASIGERAALLVALAMLLYLIATHESRWSEENLDVRLKPEFVDSYHRILDFVERGGSSSMRMNQDNYAKEFAICLHRLIPGGGQLIDPGGGIGRRILVRPPAAGLPRKIWYMVVTCGGFSPFAEFHTHQRMRHLFTADAWEYSFRLLPLVFRSYPSLKGVVGASWFFDPQVASITPSLGFVRNVSERWGGIIMRDAVYPSTTADAISMGGPRRERHERGKYYPVSYVMVAAKSRILEHAADLGELPL